MKRTTLVLLLVLSIPFAMLFSGEAEKGTVAKMRPALLVIDIQNAYLPFMSEQDKKMGLEMINYVIALFRENGFPIVRVYHTDPQRGPKPGTEAFDYPQSIAIKADDPKIIKNFANGFKKTELDKVLREKGCNTLFLCGLSAVGCVLATYHGAMDLNYQVFMVKDTLISPDATRTKYVQEICHTIDYHVLKILLENARL